MNECVCICLCRCMSACVKVYVYPCLCVSMPVSLCVSVYACVCVSVYVRMCIQVRVCLNFRLPRPGLLTSRLLPKPSPPECVGVSMGGSYCCTASSGSTPLLATRPRPEISRRKTVLSASSWLCFSPLI